MNDMIESLYSLSPLQQGLLFHSVAQPDSTEYFIQARLELSGHLNLQAFESAWQDMLQRHSILRTAFVWEGLDTPLQLVQRESELPLIVEDWQQRDKADLETMLEQDALTGFNLEQAPLMRLQLFQTGEQHWQLLWSYHHLLLDGWSVGLLMSDWLNRYSHHVGLTVSALPAPAPFAEYIAWLDRQDEVQAEAFWRSQLQGFTSPTPLPQLDGAFPSVTGLPYGEQTLDIQGKQSQSLQNFCQQQGVTLNTLLQGAWGILLGSLAGRQEALFGVTVSGRPDDVPSADTMVGLFINTLPLRLQWNEHISVGDWLTQLHTLNGDLHQYEYSPLVRLKSLSDIPGDTALFESIFVFENFPDEESDDTSEHGLSLQLMEEGKVIEGIRQTRGRNSYPISLIAGMEGKGLQLLLSYQRQRFSNTTIRILLSHLQQILEAFVCQAEQPVSQLNWMSLDDRLQQKQWGQGSALDLPKGGISEQLARIIADYPNREAVGDGKHCLTYAELEKAANQQAQVYLAQGLQAGDTLALALPRSVEMVVALVAALKVGLIYVPLDTGQPASRLASIITDSRAHLIIASTCLIEPLKCEQEKAKTETKLITLDEIIEQRRQQPFQKVSIPAPSADATAYLIYTSGSSGTPKGVTVSHRALLAYALGILDAVSLPAACRFASVSTLAADLGNTQLFGALLSGGYLHLVDDNTRFDALALADLFQQQKIDVLKLTPSHLQGLLAALPSSSLLPRHSLLLGGEALDKHLLKQIRALSPELAVYNHYGPSEATVGALLHPIDMALACQDKAPDLLSLGQPQPNRLIRILDSQGNDLPCGIPGELYLGGEGLADGYYQQTELTEDRFVNLSDSLSEAGPERFYRTGDRAYWLSDGSVKFLGRLDNQVKIRGYRVELDEVAHHLSQTSQYIQQAVVHLYQKENQPAKLLAYLVADSDLNSHKLKHDLSQQLPEYMVPDQLVLLDEIPVTANGKVDYSSLPIPATSAEHSDNYQAPATESEHCLAQIWADLLQRDNISVHDNFFALGGDSIMLLQVIARAQKQGLALTPTLAFKHRTLISLAGAIDGHDSETNSDRPSDQQQGTNATSESKILPFSPGQHFRLSQPLKPLWCRIQLHSPLQNKQLQTALTQLQQHYYPFTLERQDGSWVQRQISYSLDTVETPVIAIESTKTTEVLVDELFETMQTSNQPWLGAALSDEHLLLCAHPLALDSAAWPLLLNDLAQLYTSDDNREITLATSGLQLTRYLESEQARALSEDLDASWEYWLEHAGLELPVPASIYQTPIYQDPVSQESSNSRTTQLQDTDASSSLSQEKAISELELSNETQTQIRQLLDSHGATPVSLVTAAVACALSHHQKTDTLALAVSGGRPELSALAVTDALSQANLNPARLQGALDFPAPIIFEGLTGESHHDWQQVSSQLLAMPQAGADYGLLRYLSNNEYLSEPLLTLPTPQAWVRWLGDWDSQMTLGLLQSHHEDQPEEMPLTVSLFCLDGQLRIQVSMGESQVQPGSIQGFSQLLTKQLTQVLQSIDLTATPKANVFPLGPEQSVLDSLSLDWQQVEDIYPLTSMQHGMVIQSLKSDQADYLSQTCLQWDGPIDQGSLKAAWQQVVDRHPILRTIFLWRDLEKPLQCVLRHLDQHFFWEDITDLSETHQQDYIDQTIGKENATSLSLDNAPLTWLRVFQLSDQRFVLCHSVHHALSDAWSFGLLLDELLQSYSTHKIGRASVQAATSLSAPSPALSALSPAQPFQHYLRWLEQQPVHSAQTFWQQTLEGFDSPTALPFITNTLSSSDNSPSFITDSGLKEEAQEPLKPNAIDASQRQLVLSVEDTRRLQQFSQQQQVTVNTLIQAVWALLLARYNDTQDVLFGVNVAGRPADLFGADTMQGLFIQTLPLRVNLNDQTPLKDWLNDLLDHNLALRQYEYLPLTEIQRCSQVNADQSLFDSVMVFANAPMDDGLTSRLSDCRIDFLEDKVQTEYPLLIDVIPGSRLEFQLTFSPDRFTAEAVDMLLSRVQQLLQSLPNASEDALLGELTLLSTVEKQQLERFNKSDNDFADCGLPLNSSYPELFARQVNVQGHKVVATCGSDSLTYQELDLRSNRLGHALSQAGAQPEQLVALLAERGLPLLNAMIGTFKSGAAYMPLDPGLPSARLEDLLILSEALVLVASSQYRQAADELITRVQARTGKSLSLCIIEDHWLNGNETSLPIQSSPDSLAYVVFTSGSTGTPKGAMVEHRGMLNNMFGNRISLGLSADDRVAQTASQAFDISVWQFLAAPLMGASVHIFPDEITRNPVALLHAVQQQEITLMELVPTQIRALLTEAEAVSETESQGIHLNALRWLQSIGEALPPILVRDWLQRFPETPLLNAYGPAECSDNIGWYPLVHIPADLHSPIPVGHPTANNQLYILDSAGHEQPIGIPGEICAAGASVGRGYWQDAERTAQAFVDHPFNPKARFYRTGDRGCRLADGSIEYLGRLDFQLKLRGQRIEPGEIESCLELLAPVNKAAVVIVEQEGHSYLIAYWQGLKEVSENALRDGVSDQLPAHMVPSQFIYLEALPQNRNGKVDRNALMQKTLHFDHSGHNAPSNETERQLMTIWQSLLPVNEFGVEDNFFALGGHSLLATQVITRIRKHLSVALPITALFEYNTIASLAREIRAQSILSPTSASQENGTVILDQVSEPEIKPADRTQPLPQSYAQQRLWFMDQLEGPSGAYNIPVAIKLRGTLDRQALQASVDELLQRHESLRTGFGIQNELPQQYIVEVINSAIRYHDLTQLDNAQQSITAQQIIDEEADRPFDLSKPPMLRVALQKLADDEHILQFTLHHIAADAWSLGILIDEFTQNYAAFSSGLVPSLTPLPIQYADYAAWQRSTAMEQHSARELDYWRQALQDVPTLFNLPYDTPRPIEPDYQGAAVSHTLPAHQVEMLQNYSQGQGATLFMVLLNTFNSLLQRVTGKQDFIVGTDIANREHADLEKLIGFFVNVLPLRAQLAENESFDDRLITLRDSTLGAYQHQQVPFDKLVEMLQPERDKGVNPLVQVLFVMQNTPKGSSDLLGLTLEELEPQGETSKFDLAVFMEESETGEIHARWLYRTSLFEAATIERFVQGFTALLDYLTGPTKPTDQLLSQWHWQLSPSITSNPESKGVRKKDKLKRLKSIKPTRVSQSPVEQVKTSLLSDKDQLPLIVEPKLSELAPVVWAEQARDWIEEQLKRHGGLLFRNFNLPDAPSFEQFSQAIVPSLYGQYGDLPKNNSGQNIYHSTPYPEQHMILYHNESSHMGKWPCRQLFYCETPSPRGGCTPIVDCREVYKKLPADVLVPLEEKGLLYVRHFTDKLDVSWQDFFKTDSREEVERHCQEEGMHWHWQGDNDLRIEQYRPAVVLHPVTGEKTFFNQVQLHHESCLEAEVRANLKSLFGSDSLPRNVYYGDGTPISDATMDIIGQTYEDCAVRFNWQKGDVVMVDNMLVAHARDPFEGKRKICVAMGQMFRDQTVQNQLPQEQISQKLEPQKQAIQNTENRQD